VPVDVPIDIASVEPPGGARRQQDGVADIGRQQIAAAAAPRPRRPGAARRWRAARRAASPAWRAPAMANLVPAGDSPKITGPGSTSPPPSLPCRCSRSAAKSGPTLRTYDRRRARHCSAAKAASACGVSWLFQPAPEPRLGEGAGAADRERHHAGLRGEQVGAGEGDEAGALGVVRGRRIDDGGDPERRLRHDVVHRVGLARVGAQQRSRRRLQAAPRQQRSRRRLQAAPRRSDDGAVDVSAVLATEHAVGAGARQPVWCSSRSRLARVSPCHCAVSKARLSGRGATSARRRVARMASGRVSGGANATYAVSSAVIDSATMRHSSANRSSSSGDDGGPASASSATR